MIVLLAKQEDKEMAYIDKCCGVCKEYQELKETGKFEYLKYCEVSSPIYKRFESSNVCSDCIGNQFKFPISLFGYSKLTHKVDRSKGFVHYTNDKGVFKKAHASRFDDTCKESKEHPWLYEVFVTMTEDSDINIYDKDKRKLRKTLRKLGIVGKVERLIK